MMSDEGDWVVETSKSWRFEKLNSFIDVLNAESKFIIKNSEEK